MKQWKCAVCGYMHEGDEPPERCPVCKAIKDKFTLFVPETLATRPVSSNIFDSLETAPEAVKKITHIKTEEVALDTYYFLPGQVLDYHKHPSGDQIFVIIQGSGVFYFDDEKSETAIQLSPGTAVLAPKDKWHKIVNSGRNILVVSQTTRLPAGMIARNTR